MLLILNINTSICLIKINEDYITASYEHDPSDNACEAQIF